MDVVQFTRDSVARMADEQALERNTAAPRRLELRLTRFTVNESNKAVGSRRPGTRPLGRGAPRAARRLLKKGLITEAEHRTKRAEILEDL